jgi:hypothetical protein
MSLKNIAKFVKGSRESILPTVERGFLIRTREGKYDEEFGDKDVFHPSQIADFCGRQEQLVRHLPKKYHNTKTQRIFDFGTAIHFLYQNLILGPTLKLYGLWRNILSGEEVEGFMPSTEMFIGFIPVWVYVEPAVHNLNYNIGGHIDGLVSINGTFYVLDIKTIKLDNFNKLREPSRRYVNQLSIYMSGDFLNITNIKEVPKKAIILYICKDNSQEKEFVFSYKQDYIEDILEGIEGMLQSPNTLCPILAECSSDQFSLKRRWCKYSAECMSRSHLNLVDELTKP